MDFDLEEQLENAVIDAFDFSLMDNEEKYEALTGAGLDPCDFESIELDDEFYAWANLQDAGMSLSELEYMDEDEKREALEDAGLDPDDYKTFPLVLPAQNTLSSFVSSPGVSQNQSYRYCKVKFLSNNTLYSYRADGFDLKAGDMVIVPTGPNNVPQEATVVSVGDYNQNDLPYPLERTKPVIGIVGKHSEPISMDKPGTADVATGSYGIQDYANEPNHSKCQTSSTQFYGTSISTDNTSYRKSVLKSLLPAAIMIIFVVFLIAKVNDTNTTSKNTYSPSTQKAQTSAVPKHTTTTGNSGYRASASKPTCPPVNRERAMTKEEADALRGTG